MRLLGEAGRGGAAALRARGTEGPWMRGEGVPHPPSIFMGGEGCVHFTLDFGFWILRFWKKFFDI